MTLQEKVEEFFGLLERMFDHQTEVQISKGISAKVRLRRHLEGWDFFDLARGRDPFQLRVASLDMGSFSWVDFTRKIGAVTFFGKGFGELIIPAPDCSRTYCHEWATIPKGKYYLSAGVEDILRFIGNPFSGEESEDAAVKLLPLTTQLGWLNPSPKGHPFSACPCSTMDSPPVPANTNCCPVQFVVSSTLIKVPHLFKKQHHITHSHLEQSKNGAVIFGQGLGNLIRLLWLDNGRDPVATTNPMNDLAQPKDSSPGNDGPASTSPPTGSVSSPLLVNTSAPADSTRRSPRVDLLHTSSPRLLDNTGMSPVWRLFPLSQNQLDRDVGSQAIVIDRKQKGKNVIRQPLADLVVRNR